MKKGFQRAVAIAIAVLMIFSTIALVFPAFSVPPQPAPTQLEVSSITTEPAQIEVTSIETEPAQP